MSGVRACRVLAWIQLAVLGFALIFRAFIYRHMYEAPGEPYGISDVLEYLIGLLSLGLVAVSALVSIYLLCKGPRQNRLAAGWLLAVCAAVPLFYGPLHDLAAQLASRERCGVCRALSATLRCAGF